MEAPLPAAPQHAHIAIIGTGFGGLGAAGRLLQEGFDDLVVFERADDVGGVWRDNRYPGAACDVQSHLYAFSFAPNPAWTRRFAPREEIWQYLRDVAERFGVLPHVRFRHNVKGAMWDAEALHWKIETSRGLFTADLLVAAPGALAEPRLPRLPGLDTFGGLVLHSSRWDERLDLAGKRVALVGTGASAVQLVPALQPVVGHLTLFQRTAPWVLPRRDRALGERGLLQRWPRLQRLVRGAIHALREAYGLMFRHPAVARLAERVARRHLRRQVADPDLRRALTPDYLFGCKRVLLSDDYYPALAQPNVTVVAGGAAGVRPGAVVEPDGTEHPADVLVFATGFHILAFVQRLHNAAGESLAAVWRGVPAAHVGTTVHGFPNLFLIQGPNTGHGYTSVILMIEAQIEHVVNAARYLRARGLAAAEPTEAAQAGFMEEVDRRAEGTVWSVGQCSSWYQDATGRNSALWPGSAAAFRRRAEPFDPSDYYLYPAPATADAVSL